MAAPFFMPANRQPRFVDSVPLVARISQTCDNRLMSWHFPVSRLQSILVVLAAGLVVTLTPGCVSKAMHSDGSLTRIGFGSCINTQAHPMLDRTLTLPFDLFILLGDNIYADTTNAAVMAKKYHVRKESTFFQALRKKAPLLATWDDHDFGGNDAGSNYVMRIQSQKLFLDFMDEPADSPRRKREGVYDSYLFGPIGKRVQVILFDTRYFRSALATGENNVLPSGGKYIPHPDPDVTMLGEAQWKWLEEQLRVPADLRIIGSSIQFISEFSGAEAWANMPREKKRMLDLLKTTQANGVLFISGDRHWAELSRIDREGDYPLYDLTSSALTEEHKRGTPTPNRFREGPTFHETNVGLITIDWQRRGPVVFLHVLDVKGITRIEKRIAFQKER
jgi:alkaline phosphatase D